MMTYLTIYIKPWLSPKYTQYNLILQLTKDLLKVQVSGFKWCVIGFLSCAFATADFSSFGDDLERLSLRFFMKVCIQPRGLR